jgi:N-acetylneuraminic acid mutarotase
MWLRWDGRKLDITPAPSLPGALANCCAASISGRAYVVGGQRLPSSTEASNAVYSLDLNDNRAEWQTEAPIPGPARILPSVAATADTLYVAGGATLYADEQGKPKRRYLRDAWQWKPVEGWRALPDLPELTCAAPAACPKNSFWVLGGSDGSLDAREAELRDQHPGFRRSARIFDSETGTWSEPVTVPFSLVTTTALVWDGLLVVPGGEDRPAHRSAEVHACRFAEKHG